MEAVPFLVSCGSSQVQVASSVKECIPATTWDPSSMNRLTMMKRRNSKQLNCNYQCPNACIQLNSNIIRLNPRSHHASVVIPIAHR